MAGEFSSREKLTKKFLFSLQTGLYISSNTLRRYDVNIMGPIFHEYVAPENEREAQWKRIVSTGTNGRLCNVWGTQEQFFKYFPGIKKILKK